MKNRQIYFVRRPETSSLTGVFDEREAEVRSPEEGQLLCRNVTVLVDPYLRLKMYDRRSYTLPLQVGEGIPGRTISEVIESRAEGCVDEIANARMGKRRRMRWSARGAHRVAVVRAAVLDGRISMEAA